MEHATVHGVEIPVLGFGTWQLKGEECKTAVQSAIEVGYRHIDTAQMYGNEHAVGAAIEDSSVDRDDVFLVTKVRRRNLSPNDIRHTVTESVERLGTDIDLLLIHSPSETVPLEDSIAAMNRLQEKGVVGNIGVSNFSVAQWKAAIDASETPILTNQVEYNPFETQDSVYEFCLENDLLLTAYSPLAEQAVIGSETLQQIGDGYGKSEAQVALRWLIQQENVAAIPKAASTKYQEENIDVFDFELTDDEMEQVAGLQRA